MAERADEECVDGDADHDRRDAVQHVGRVADPEGNRAPPVLREVDSAEEADRNADQRRHEEDLGAADDRVRHATAGLTDRRGQVREEAERERRDAVDRDVTEEEEQDADGCRGRQPRRGEHDPLDDAPAPIAPGDGCHAAAEGDLCTRPMSRRAIAFTTSVIANSTSPISTRAAR